MNDTMTYEGMFLVEAGRDFGNASEPIKTVLDRAEAEVLSMKPWDERRLAYEIKDRKRALYVLTYFKADPQKMADLERDAQLNEGILRMQVLRREDITDEMINAETPATQVQQQREARAAEEEAKAAEAEAEGGEAKGEGEEPKTEGEEAKVEPAEAKAEESEQVEPAAEPVEESTPDESGEAESPDEGSSEDKAE